MIVTCAGPIQTHFKIRTTPFPLYTVHKTASGEGEEKDDTGIAFVPGVNIRSHTEGYTAEFELPGMKKDEIKITFEENVLTVSGERKGTQETSDRWMYRERNIGRFKRSIRFKTDVAAAKISATYSDGILHVDLPFSEEAKPKDIPIQ